MKKLITLILVGMIAVTAVACSGKDDESSSSLESSAPSSSAVVSTPSTPSSAAPAGDQTLSDVIAGARSQDFNDAFEIITSKDHEMAQLIFDVTGLNPDDMEEYAISVSPMNTKAYGVAIIKPIADKADAVSTAVNTWVDNQRKAFDQYLPDQKEIADAAVVETLDDGTILLVMSEDGATVLESLKKGLGK